MHGILYFSNRHFKSYIGSTPDIILFHVCVLHSFGPQPCAETQSTLIILMPLIHLDLMQTSQSKCTAVSGESML